MARVEGEIFFQSVFPIVECQLKLPLVFLPPDFPDPTRSSTLLEILLSQGVSRITLGSGTRQRPRTIEQLRLTSDRVTLTQSS